MLNLSAKELGDLDEETKKKIADAVNIVALSGYLDLVRKSSELDKTDGLHLSEAGRFKFIAGTLVTITSYFASDFNVSTEEMRKAYDKSFDRLTPELRHVMRDTMEKVAKQLEGAR